MRAAAKLEGAQSMGQFIQADQSLETLEQPHTALKIPIFSGHKAVKSMRQFCGPFRVFDEIVERVAAFDAPYEDQCSSEYYFDLVRTLRDLNGEFGRVVEVGVYMGGASVMLAGCSQKFDFDLDLVDLNAGYLRFSYERIRRTYPEATGRVRLYQGELADYVRDVCARHPSAWRSPIYEFRRLGSRCGVWPRHELRADW